MSVTLLHVLAAARARYAPLVGETAGYLALGVADHVLAARRSVDPANVSLFPDGSLGMAGGIAASDVEAEGALRQLLGRLLGTARSVTPALQRAAQRTPSGGVEAFVRELEAGLIPVNRAAGRRALSRLHRETVRALQAGDIDEHPAAEPPVAAAPPPAPEPHAAQPAPEPPAALRPAVPEPRVAPAPAPEPPAAVDEPTTSVDAEVVPAAFTPSPLATSPALTPLPELPPLELTRPEPALVRAAARAQEVSTAPPTATPPTATPPLGSLEVAMVASGPQDLSDPEIPFEDPTDPVPGGYATPSPDVRRVEFVPEPGPGPEPALPSEAGWDLPEGEDSGPRPPAARGPAQPRFLPQRSNVTDLLAQFSVVGPAVDGELCSLLKRVAGLDATPPPAAVAGDDRSASKLV
jgi:hypothetical protein